MLDCTAIEHRERVLPSVTRTVSDNEGTILKQDGEEEEEEEEKEEEEEEEKKEDMEEEVEKGEIKKHFLE